MARSADPVPVALTPGAGARAWRVFRAYPLGAIGAVILGVMAVAAIFAPWLAPYDPLGTNYSLVVRPPSAAHPLGTDQFGRDVLSRIIFGARVTLLVAISSVLIGDTIGFIWAWRAATWAAEWT